MATSEDSRLELKRFLRAGQEPLARPPVSQPRPPVAPAVVESRPPAVVESRPPMQPAPAIDPEELRAAVNEAVRHEIDGLRGELDAAFEEVSHDIGSGRRELALLRTELLKSLGEIPEPATVDLSSLENELSNLRSGLSEYLVKANQRTERGLGALAEGLGKQRRAPVEVDTRKLEDAATRGALQNAADINELQRKITVLTEAVTLQDKNLGELRNTLDWIKERLLLR